MLRLRYPTKRKEITNRWQPTWFYESLSLSTPALPQRGFFGREYVYFFIRRDTPTSLMYPPAVSHAIATHICIQAWSFYAQSILTSKRIYL